MAKKKSEENTTVGDENQTQTQTAGQDAATPAEQTPAPNTQKPKKGKVEVAADAAPVENDEADKRLVDARNEALNNHARANG